MGYLADRLTGLRARRQAKQFAKAVRPGDTWYSIEECHDWIQGAGSVPRYRAWRFEKPSWPGIWPESGRQGAESIWLRHGPLLPTPPPELADLFDLDGSARDMEERYARRLEQRVQQGLAA